VRTALGLAAYEYVVVALLQRATVDGAGRAARLVGGLGGLAARAPVVLALPSRTATALADAGIARTAPGIRSAGSLAPLAFLGLAAEAGAIVTDSGSVQEEASALGVPCFTLGTATERPVTLIHGTNTLLGDDAADLAGVAAARRPPAPATIPLWDGRAAGRIADVLVANFALRGHLRAGR
jgi:UDP-N-acetylglucosamine 2-epimerase (non-hydrolysing)